MLWPAEGLISAPSARNSMKIRLKINGLIIFCAFLAITLFPTVFFRNGKIASLDRVAEIFGVTFILLGQIIRVSARGYKSEHSQNGHSLIQGGPYALVRNPMYLGILLIGMGVALVLFNWLAMCIFLGFFIIRYILLIFKEEKKLSALFPQSYPAYRQRVPRILPLPNVLLEKDISEYLPLRLSWLKKEIGPILVVLLFTLLLESWEDIKNRGIAIYFKEATAYLAIILLFAGIIIYLSRRTENLEKDVPNKS